MEVFPLVRAVLLLAGESQSYRTIERENKVL